MVHDPGNNSTKALLDIFWAKTGKDGNWHTLINHCIDVGMVAKKLLVAGYFSLLTKSPASESGFEKGHLISAISCLVALHDIGKAIPSFQGLNAERAVAIEKAGFNLQSTAEERMLISHGQASFQAIQVYLERQVPSLDISTVNGLADAVAMHHGKTIQSDTHQASVMGGDKWQQARETLIEQIWNSFCPDQQLEMLAHLPGDKPGFFTVLAGLTSIADWIGSNTEFFPFESKPFDPAYIKNAEERAQQALIHTGWLPKLATAAPAEFADIFPFPPNSLQKTMIAALERTALPALFVVEAQMGLGKTEAAISVIDTALSNGHQGAYIALPTTATSNAMHARFKDTYLSKRFPQEQFDAKLVHGNAHLLALMESLNTYDEDGNQPAANARAAGNATDWFAPKKRSLLTPFGIGTIDQSLLGVLTTKHWFVRLAGLAGKVIVFDEVHAYDTYMSTILERLMTWLSQLGCTVVLLSATLPHSKRQALLKAYHPIEEPDIPKRDYPAITSNSRSETNVFSVTAETTGRSVPYTVIQDDIEATCQRIVADSEQGGCIAVICNTVQRAQDIYEKLTLLTGDIVLTSLFHARVPMHTRQQWEQEVLRLYGKPESANGTTPARPRSAILVATQVIEQSLDLDFDVIYSDIAPADLLIQRVGRMHRHQRSDRCPARKSPALHIIIPADIGTSTRIANATVYDRAVTLRTWHLLKSGNSIELPGDIDALIQAVYSDSRIENLSNDEQAVLEEAVRICNNEADSDMKKAQNVLVGAPEFSSDASYEEILPNKSWMLSEDEEDPELHTSIRAATRLGPPSIRIVCLEQDGSILRAVNGTAVDLEVCPSNEQQLAIHRSVASISFYPAYKSLCNAENTVPAWRSIASLRHLRPVIFTGGIAQLNDEIVLRLDPELGISF